MMGDVRMITDEEGDAPVALALGLPHNNSYPQLPAKKDSSPSSWPPMTANSLLAAADLLDENDDVNYQKQFSEPASPSQVVCFGNESMLSLPTSETKTYDSEPPSLDDSRDLDYMETSQDGHNKEDVMLSPLDSSGDPAMIDEANVQEPPLEINNKNAIEYGIQTDTLKLEKSLKTKSNFPERQLLSCEISSSRVQYENVAPPKQTVTVLSPSCPIPKVRDLCQEKIYIETVDVPMETTCGSVALSSSMPTTSYGDQERDDLEVMHFNYALDDSYLNTTSTLEKAAGYLSKNLQKDSLYGRSDSAHNQPLVSSCGANKKSPGSEKDNQSASGHQSDSGDGMIPPNGAVGGNGSHPPSLPVSRASSRSEAEFVTDNEYLFDDIDEVPVITLGICAMQKKTDSKPMKQILTRLKAFEYLKILIFEESVILNEPVENWPTCDCLISFYSTDFPLDKAIEYAKLREPFCLNDLTMQKVLFDRRAVYKILQKEGLPVPRYAVVDRDDPDFSESQVVEEDDSITINGKVFKKPFVEKPLDAEDHNVTIYFQMSAGGGCQKLFRKIGSVSSTYSGENRVRKTGSYIYEEFKPTDGCDVKVYAVGTEYAHAEARKAPGLDGRVERDSQGKEVRYPVLLSHFEKFIARTISLAFKQTVCGFDLLRANGKSYICDVNGFSFVKNNSKYYDDCAKILGTVLLKHMAPDFNIPLHLTVLNEEIPVVPTTRGTMMELRCVIGVLRHGDRQPKQKMKMEVFHQSFIDLFVKFGGTFTSSSKSKIKLKQPRELQAILDTVLHLLEISEHKDFELKENLSKLEQLKSVLQMYGYFSGINRKIQMKCLKCKAKTNSSSEDEKSVTTTPMPSILLIAKWGGELTPLGRVHAEALGKAFRCMYPGGASYNDDGSGLLRLHSTFRHDLKIYASDEGRVQMTAAAFAKGLLALDGELTPILVHMVKCAKTNALLDHDEMNDDGQNGSHHPIASQEDIKKTLKEIFHKDRKFTQEDYQKLAPTGGHSLINSMHVIDNPVQMCENVYAMIQKVAAQIRNWAAVPNKVQNLSLYNEETFDMMARRWSKLEKDFKNRQSGVPPDKRQFQQQQQQNSEDKKKDNTSGTSGLAEFDISKIPDIYDCIKYDTLHNSHLPIPCKNELYAASKALADVVVPQEYGMSAAEKFRIALKICTPLLRKIRCDLQRNLNQSAYRLHPKYSENVLSPNRQVRTRLYFTSESHIHSLVNTIRYGGLFPDPDEQWAAADKHLSFVTELNYLSHLVFLLYEDPTKDLKSEERYKLEVQFSPGIRYWEETDSYPIGTKFYPKSPPNIHQTSAKEFLSFSTGKSALNLTNSKKTTAHVHSHGHRTMKVQAPPVASVSTSDLTDLQMRGGRNRSVENLQRRSSSGNTTGGAINNGATVAMNAAAANSSSSNISGNSKKGVVRNVAKKKEGTVRNTSARSFAKVARFTGNDRIKMPSPSVPSSPSAATASVGVGGDGAGGMTMAASTTISSSIANLPSPSHSAANTAVASNTNKSISDLKANANYAFLSGNNNSGSAPNLSSIYHEKFRRENMLPTAIVTSKLLKDFCPVEVLHNNLNVGQLERFLDHVTEGQGIKTPPMMRHVSPINLINGKNETIIEETDSKPDDEVNSIE